MANIDGILVDLIWLHLDTTKPGVNGLLVACANRNKNRFPDFQLSVNRNLADTQALVKVNGTPADFVLQLPPPLAQSIIRTFTEADHAEAYAMVTTVEWAGEHVPLPEPPP
jgi:hypothetical protein